MKVLMIMGRGIEGTGNTRITIELKKYIEDQNNYVKVVAAADKAWGRRASQEVNDFINHKFQKAPYIDDEIYDMCIVMSVPPKAKKSAKIKADPILLDQFNKTQGAILDNFIKTMKILKDKGTKMLYMQVDHKIHSISRNFYALEEYTQAFYELLDRVIVHGLENDFCKKFIDRKIKPLDNIHFDIKDQLAISCDYDEVNSFIKPHEKIKRSAYFIGRSATWKGWTYFRDLHENYLKQNGYVSIIEGIEMSINAKDNLYTKEGKKYIAPRSDNTIMISNKLNENETPEYVITHADEFRNEPVFIYGPFNRIDALNRLAHSKFGMFFSFLGKEYDGPLENTLLETVAVGTIPVIRKELWESAKFNGDMLTNYIPREIGFIVYDEKNPIECVDLMNFIDENDKLYNDYIERAQAFCRKNFDRKVIMKRLFDRCTEGLIN